MKNFLSMFSSERSSIITKVLKIVILLWFFLMTFSIVNNYYFSKLLDKEFREQNNKEMDNIVKTVLEHTETVKNLLAQMKEDKQVILFNALPADTADRVSTYEAFLISRFLESLKITNSNIIDIFICFNKHDIVVSGDGIYEEELFYSEIVTSGNADIYEVAHGNSQGKDIQIVHGQYKFSRVYESSSDNSFYIYPGADIAVIIVIDRNHLNLSLNRMFSSRGTIVTVLDKDNNIYTCSKPDSSEEILKLTKGKDPVIEGEITSIGGKEYFASFKRTEKGDLTFLVLHKNDELMNNIYRLNIYTLYLLFIFCLFVILIYFIINKQLYLPVKYILRKINNTNSTANKSKNEYDILDTLIHNMYNELESMRYDLKEQEKMITENCINRFISGFENVGNGLYDRDKNLGTFIILTCIFEEIKGEHDVKAVKGFEKLLGEVFEYKKVFVYSKETVYLVVIDAIKDYRNVIRDVYEKMEHKNTFCLSAASRPYSDFDKIKKAYEESRMAINYSIINFSSDNEMLYFYNEDMVKSDSRFDINISEVEQLMNALLSGDSKNVGKNFNTIILKNCNKSYICQKELYIYLMNIFSVVLNSKSMNAEDILGMTLNQFMSELREIYSITRRKDMVVESFKKLSIKIMESKGELLDKMLEYIEANYENQISLQMLADELNMSLAYISHYFNKSMGKSFVDYVQSLRVEKAKEILAQTNKSINEVAKNTGYDTVNTFIRTFKKHTGYTPGEYRKTGVNLKNNLK